MKLVNLFKKLLISIYLNPFQLSNKYTIEYYEQEVLRLQRNFNLHGALRIFLQFFFS